MADGFSHHAGRKVNRPLNVCKKALLFLCCWALLVQMQHIHTGRRLCFLCFVLLHVLLISESTIITE